MIKNVEYRKWKWTNKTNCNLLYRKIEKSVKLSTTSSALKLMKCQNINMLLHWECLLLNGFVAFFFQVAWQTISDRCFLKWYISRWYIFCDSNANFKWQMVEGYHKYLFRVPPDLRSPKVSGLGSWIQIPGLLGNARYVSIWRKMEVAVMFWSIWIFTWIAFSISQQKKTQIYKKHLSK